MWLVEQLAIVPRVFDFGSNGGHRFETRAVIADGTEIANAVDLLSIVDDSCQIVECEFCGGPRCGSGNWVSFRRLDDSLVLMPAFALMQAGDLERSEYAPPSYIDARGALLLSRLVRESIGTETCDMFSLVRRPISGLEVAQVLQWQAPANALGEFPSRPSLAHERVVAVTHGTGDEASAALEALLRTLMTSPSVKTVSLVNPEPVIFYLRPDGYVEWQPMCFSDGTYYLVLAPGLVIGPAAQVPE